MRISGILREALKIVEVKDATDTERAVTLCNSGVVMADADTLFALIDKVRNDNASSEYYLTDIVEIARAMDRTVTAIACEESETLGINSRSASVPPISGISPHLPSMMESDACGST